MSMFSLQNKLVWLLEGDDVKSHLIQWGFVEGYMVWKFHSEEDVSGASRGTLSSVHAEH